MNDDAFNKWWDKYYDVNRNPNLQATPTYWAIAGWNAALQAKALWEEERRENALREVQRLGLEIQPEKD
jgi:hypothetical protein